MAKKKKESKGGFLDHIRAKRKEGKKAGKRAKK